MSIINAIKIINQLNIAIFQKNLDGSFIYCNEYFCECAAVDSPQQLIGKTDYDTIWRDQAAIFREADKAILTGKSHINIIEVQTRPQGLIQVLATKQILCDDWGKPAGVMGSFIELDNQHFHIYKNGHLDESNKRFYFTINNQQVYFTLRELDIFKYILKGYTNRLIAKQLSLSTRTVEDYIGKIKAKLQCKSKTEVLATAVKWDLLYLACV